MSLKPKSRPPTQPAVVTANRLVDGTTVWRTASGSWSEHLGDAAIYRGDAITAATEAALADERRQIVVGSYATDVASDAPVIASPAPLSLLRERIRATGPTIAYGPRMSETGAATSRT